MHRLIIRSIIVAMVPSIILITVGCQKLNMHKAPREDLYFAVPDYIPELEQESRAVNRRDRSNTEIAE